MTKHDAVTAFFQPKAEELAGQYLEFNYSDDYSGISLVTNYSDKLLKKYLWGSEKEYGFSIIIVQPYSTDTDDLNLTAMNFAQAFMDWLEEQNKKRNYPEFPNSCPDKEDGDAPEYAKSGGRQCKGRNGAVHGTVPDCLF